MLNRLLIPLLAAASFSLSAQTPEFTVDTSIGSGQSQINLGTNAVGQARARVVQSFIQAAVPDSGTGLVMLPNGTGTTSRLYLRNSSDPANYAMLLLRSTRFSDTSLSVVNVGKPANPFTSISIGELPTSNPYLQSIKLSFGDTVAWDHQSTGIVVNPIHSAASNPLPATASDGATSIVIDALNPTYLGPYIPGGTSRAQVIFDAALGIWVTH